MVIVANHQNKERFVEVMIPLALEGTLTYSILPNHPRVVVGSRVVVPFRKKWKIGIIVAIHNRAPATAVKSVIEFPDNQPFYSPSLYKLIEWMHLYYLAPLGSVIRATLEAQKHYLTPTFRQLKPINHHLISPSLSKEKILSWETIYKHLGYEKGVACIAQFIQDKCLSLAPPLPQVNLSTEQLAPVSRKKKSTYIFSCSAPLQEHIATIIKQIKASKNIYLQGGDMAQQNQIYQAIVSHIIEEGGQVLYLCARKTVVKATLKQLKKKWKKRVQGYYSGILPSSKQKVAMGVEDQSISCVVGRLGSIFLPFSNLKLIIISEAEDKGYKQIGVSPRYHARHTALMLAHYQGIPTLQGDIVPSVESYYNMQKDKYYRVALPNISSSKVELVGLTFAQYPHQAKGIIAPAIWGKIDQALAKQRSIVVMHHRKGYAHYHRCSQCEWIAKCSQCQVSLTYHQITGKLSCHYCNTTLVPFRSCPSCNSSAIKQHGMGIQQVEELFHWQYPTKKIVHLDYEGAITQKSHTVIAQWLAKSIDILIVSPRVMKELPAHQGGLAILLDMDERIKQINWKVEEEVFYDLAKIKAQGYDLLVQTASKQLRKVVYQTITQDVAPFYQAILADRKIGGYPPYAKLVCVMLFPQNISLANQLAEELKKSQSYPILGPSPTTPIVGVKSPPIALWVLLPTYQLSKSKKKLYYFVYQWVKKKRVKGKIIWDVDPC